MIVFKTYWCIVKRYWWIVFLYVAILTSLSVINLSATPAMDFTDTKPQITIINQSTADPSTTPYTNNFLEYLRNNTEIVELSADKITDALFYQETSLVLYLPQDLEQQITSGQKITLNYQTTGNYSSELTKNLITRYFELQNTEANNLSALNHKLSASPTVNLAVKNTTNLKKISSFFNFASYTITAIILYITCFINASFNKTTTKKRTLVSSLPLTKYNLALLLSSSIFAFTVFLLFIVLSFLVLGSIIFTPLFLFHLLATFLFTLCALTLAQLVSSFALSKEAISGVVNLLSLAPAFLSGAFIPSIFLPDFILTIAHIFPSFWYIDINTKITTLEQLNFNSFLTLLPNFLVLILFSLIFIILNLLLNKYRRRSV